MINFTDVDARVESLALISKLWIAGTIDQLTSEAYAAIGNNAAADLAHNESQYAFDLAFELHCELEGINPDETPEELIELRMIEDAGFTEDAYADFHREEWAGLTGCDCPEDGDCYCEDKQEERERFVVPAGAYSAEELVAIAKYNGELSYIGSDYELIISGWGNTVFETPYPSFALSGELPF